ncbi:MAG: hypothetical protein COA79_19150 [Planctomycetota bacterium]|nr:MAG: hypothetical protein COA79_19150 [Planctomycetota bacterium]
MENQFHCTNKLHQNFKPSATYKINSAPHLISIPTIVKKIMLSLIIYISVVNVYSQNDPTKKLVDLLGDQNYFTRMKAKNLLVKKGIEAYLPLKKSLLNNDLEIAELSKEIINTFFKYQVEGFRGDYIPVDKNIKTNKQFRKYFYEYFENNLMSEYNIYGKRNISWDSEIFKLIHLSRVFYESNNHDSVELKKVIEKLIKKNCDDGVALYLISRFYLQDKDYSQARKSISMGLEQISKYKGSRYLPFEMNQIAAVIAKKSYQFEKARKFSKKSMIELAFYFSEIILKNESKGQLDRIYYSYVERIYNDNSHSNKEALYIHLNNITGDQNNSLYQMIKGRHQNNSLKYLGEKNIKTKPMRKLGINAKAISSLVKSLELNPEQPEVIALIIKYYGTEFNIKHARYWFDKGIRIEIDCPEIFEEFIKLVVSLGSNADLKAFKIECLIAAKIAPNILNLIKKHF